MTNPNTNPDYYKDELYLDEDFRMLAKTYPADVSAIGVTTLIDYVEAVEAELARLTAELAEKGEYENKLVNTVDFMQTEIDRLTAELHYANTVCMEQKHVIDRLKEDAERLAMHAHYDEYEGLEAVFLHRVLMKELEK